MKTDCHETDSLLVSDLSCYGAKLIVEKPLWLQMLQLWIPRLRILCYFLMCQFTMGAWIES